MKWLNYHHLIYFKVIAEEGSLAAASKKLLVGQSSLSSQLKTFEETIGHALFHRRKNALVLTEAGKLTLEYAKGIHLSGQELISTLDSGIFENKIKIKVGVLDAIPKRVVYHILNRTINFKKVKTHIYEGHDQQLFQDLLKMDLYVLVTDNLGLFERTDRFRSKKFLSSPIKIYGTENFLSYKKNFPYSLKDAPMIYPAITSKLRANMDHYFQSIGVAPKIVVEVEDTSFLKIFASEGVGVVPLPDLALRDLTKSKQLYSLGEIPELFEHYYLVALKREIAHPVVDGLFY